MNKQRQVVVWSHQTERRVLITAEDRANFGDRPQVRFLAFRELTADEDVAGMEPPMVEQPVPIEYEGMDFATSVTVVTSKRNGLIIIGG